MKNVLLFATALVLSLLVSCDEEKCVGPGANHPPILAGISDTSIVSGDTLKVQAVALDVDDDPLEYLLIVHRNNVQAGIPDVEFSEETGSFEFFAAESDAPSRSFDIIVLNGIYKTQKPT